MAEESHVVRSFNWKDIFPFVVIFRGFRIAIHPSKMVLALIALVLVYGGGNFLDLVWPSQQRAVANEIGEYEQSRSSLEPDKFFADLRTQQIDAQQADLHAALNGIGKPDGNVDDLKYKILQDRDAAVRAAQAEYERSPGPAAETNRQGEIQEAYQNARASIDQLDGYRTGLFVTFREYELGQINVIVRSVRVGNFIGPGGATVALVRFFATGPSWAIRNHPVFFAL